MKPLHRLAAAGHDSELFSFIDDKQRDELESHPAARLPLWTLGSTDDGALRKVCQWNGLGSFVSPDRLQTRAADGSNVLRQVGMLLLGVGDDAIAIEALVLVRQLLMQGNGAVWSELEYDPYRDGAVLLHRGQWLDAGDRNYTRIRYIRRHLRPESQRSRPKAPERYSTSDREFVELRDSLVRWAIDSLDAALARSQRTEAAA